MPTSATDSLARHRAAQTAAEEAVASEESTSTATDSQLLRQFIRSSDTAAFTALVERLGPLVFSVALRSVRDLHAAEDVFQATFLVLARDARKIRAHNSLRPWLHGIALRMAKRALVRRRRETPMPDLQPLDDEESPFEALSRQAEQELVDEELRRLPVAYRAPLLLHLLEGRTCEETAALLGTTLGAVRGRIQRGKQELKLRLTRRGIEFPAMIGALALWQSTAEAMFHTPLITATAAGGTAISSGTPIHPSCSPEAVHLALQETVMLSTGKFCAYAAAFLCATVCGWMAHAVAGPVRSGDSTAIAQPRVETRSDFESRDRALFPDGAILAFADTQPPEADTDAPLATILKYGDDQPDGKKSIAGTGEMIRFQLPDANRKLLRLRVHCSRYGTPQPPREDAEILIVSDDNSTVIHSEPVPYSTFKRGDNRWTTIRFHEPVSVPESFWVILDFDAAQTKGVYVSYDTASGGEHSRTGLPGAKATPVSFGGDWMVQAILAAPGEPAANADAASPTTAAAPDPRIVETTPKNGATDVDPALRSITVTFDRDMQTGMSWTSDRPSFPKVDTARQPRWINARTCELPVILTEASYYRVGINSQSFGNFRDLEGTAARPTALSFTTQGAAEEIKQRMHPPEIMNLEPANGARDVSPGTTELKVTFDRPMAAGMSWVGGGEHFPMIPAGQSVLWSPDRRSCALSVQLNPDWDYQLGLNSLTDVNFQSEWGVPLAPVEYKFKTAAEK